MTRLRQLWLLTAVGSVLVLAAGYFLLISPKNKEAAALRSDTETQESVNKQLKSQIDMLNKQKKDLPAQQAKLARFGRLIPPNPSLPSLTRAFSDAADNSGVELKAINPTLPDYTKGKDLKTRVELPGRVAGPNGSTLADIPIQVKVEGSYSQLTQFFTEVEELTRALLVQGFSVEVAKDTEENSSATPADKLTADLKVLVMMTKKAANSSAPTTSTTKTTSSTAKK